MSRRDAWRWMALAGALLWPARLSATTLEQVTGFAAVQRAFLREEFSQVVGLAQAFILSNPSEPDMPRVWLWLVLSLDKLQQSNEALREISRLKDRLAPDDPIWPEVLYWEGDISRRSLQAVRARMTFQRLLERYPDATWALQSQLGLGLIDLQQQAFESAIANFRQVQARQPDSAIARDASLFEGVCLMQLKQFAEAEQLFTRLLKETEDPVGAAQAAFYLGEALSGQARFEEAIPAYQRAVAVEQAPQWRRPAQFGLGWASYRLGRCDEAVKIFDQFLRGATTDHQTEAWFAQGSCLLKLERDNDALSLFEQIVSRDPTHALAAESGVIIADTYRKQGRSALAHDVLHRLLDRRLDASMRTQIQLRLASIALEEGNAAQARTLYQMAREAPEPATQQAALSGLGDVQMFLGDMPGARHTYEEVERQLPDSSLARYAAYQLGRLALQGGAFEDAVAAFQRLLASPEPGLADDARFALALAYLNQQDGAQARSTLDELHQRQPNSVSAGRAAYYLALIRMNENDEAAAKSLCQETIAKAPQTEEAVNAQLLIADFLTRQESAAEASRWLRAAYTSARLPRRHRAKIAKRLGDLARSERAYAEAMLWYDEAAELLPTMRGESAYQIGACYEEAGDLALAMSWYRHVAQEPWRVRGQMALAKLLEREQRYHDAAVVYQQLSQEPIPEASLAAERLVAARELEREQRKEHR